MIVIKETAGDTIQGAIDGANTDFVLSFDIAEPVSVYHNGILLQANLETGYDIVLPRTIRMREAPQSGPDDPDTLEVEYRADAKAGGGALGGCPSAPIMEAFVGGAMCAREDRPGMSTRELEPTTTGQADNTPSTTSAQDLRPSMLGTNGEGSECP